MTDATNPPAEPSEIRKAFEVWAKDNVYPIDYQPDAECGVEGGPVYRDSRTHAAWWAYREGLRAQAVPADPMDWPLPCDVTVGHGTMRKGVRLGTLVARMKVLYEMAMGMNADEVAGRSLEERAGLQGQLFSAPAEALCPCKERPTSACKEPWGPTCEIVKNLGYSTPAEAKQEPMHVGACITDGRLHVTVMQRKGSVVHVVATAEMDAATLHKCDGIAVATPQPQAAQPVGYVSVETLARMTESLEGLDPKAPGTHWRKGWNDSIRRAMDYATAAPALTEGQERDKRDAERYRRLRANLVGPVPMVRVQVMKRGQYLLQTVAGLDEAADALRSTQGGDHE